MKQAVALILAFVICLPLCACQGNSNSNKVVEENTPKSTEMSETNTNSPSSELVGYADDEFTFEAAGYEVDSFGVTICFKFRNISEKHLDRASFTVQMLDSNSDVIDTKHITYIEGIDAEQAVWYELRTDETKECSTINELNERIHSFKIVSLYATEDDSDDYGYYNLDFKEPVVIEVANIQPKN